MEERTFEVAHRAVNISKKLTRPPHIMVSTCTVQTSSLDSILESSKSGTSHSSVATSQDHGIIKPVLFHKLPPGSPSQSKRTSAQPLRARRLKVFGTPGTGVH